MAKFVKGQSGNPGGRPKDDPVLKDLCRVHTQESVATLVEIMQSKEAPHAARLSAACALLDRGYGKPVQAIEGTGENGEIPLSIAVAFVNAANSQR